MNAPTTPVNADSIAGRRYIAPVDKQSAGRSPSNIFSLREASRDFIELLKTSRTVSAAGSAAAVDLHTDHSARYATNAHGQPCRKHRCARPFFNEKLYQESIGRFWSMPATFSEPSANGDSILRRLWDSPPAVAVLPVLGLYARTDRHSSLFLSQEEIGRLTGLSPDSIGRSRRPLIKEGLVRSCGQARDHGKAVTVWNLDRERFVHLDGEKSTNNSFLFHASMLAGGHWARLSSVQKVLYLAVATQAFTSRQPPAEINLLQRSAPSVALQRDVIACYEQRKQLRLASASLAEISRISGASRSSLISAINALKTPTVWGNMSGDGTAIRYSPLRVYPSDVPGKQHVYHFRDHVDHWPWELLNECPTCTCAKSAVSEA